VEIYLTENTPVSSYNETLQEIASQKNLTVQQLEKFLDELAFIESQGNYNAIQRSPGAVNKDGEVTNQGPGRGAFQIEKDIGDASGRNKTTLQRAINYYDSDATNRKAPEWMLSLKDQDYDASELTPEQQRELVILDLRMGPGDLADLPKLGTLGIWSKDWKVVGAEPGSPDYIRAEKDLKIFSERLGDKKPVEQQEEEPLEEEPSFFNDLIQDYANPFLQRIFGK